MKRRFLVVIKNYIYRANVRVKNDSINDVLIKGFKFRFAGRYKRKSRRSVIWYRYGSTKSFKLSDKVDYSEVSLPLKYSLFSIRVWIYKDFIKNKYS